MNYSDLNLDFDHLDLIYVNNNNILVATQNEEYIKNIRSQFTNDVKQARFSPSYKSGNWDGKIRFIQSNGLLPYGLLAECVGILKKLEIPFRLDEKLKVKQIDISNFEKVIEKELIEKQGENKLIPRDYQWNTAKVLLKARRGITKSATSSGKSYTMSMISKYLLHQHYVEKILIVVPRSDLVIQLERDYLEYGIDKDMIGLYFGSIKDEGKAITIATWQTLQNVTEPEFFAEFDALLVDEVHGAKTNDKSSKSKRKGGNGTKMRQICDLCINASWRFGFTGTMPTEDIDVRTVVSGIGSVVDEVRAVDLMDQGHITKLKIIIPFVSYDKKLSKDLIKQNLKDLYEERGITKETKKEDIPTTLKYLAEKKFLENYIPRYKLIARIAKKRLRQDENILILVNTLSFGGNVVKILRKLLKDEMNGLYYIHGSVEGKKREEIRDIMESSTRVIIVATTSLFSTGISVKNLHSVIFTSIGKSKILAIQSIGRALRKHGTKDVARVYDIVDNVKYSLKQAKERLTYYSEEEYDHEIIEVNI